MLLVIIIPHSGSRLRLSNGCPSDGCARGRKKGARVDDNVVDDVVVAKTHMCVYYVYVYIYIYIYMRIYKERERERERERHQ